MKKVLYFVLFALTAFVCGCNKDEEDDIPNRQSQKIEPSYKSWKGQYLDLGYKSIYKSATAYYNNDSIAFSYYMDFDVLDTTMYIDHLFSNHGMVFASVDPSAMNENEIIALAEQWYNEIQKEPDIPLWIGMLKLLDTHNTHHYNDTPVDYGMLWGMKYERYDVNDFLDSKWVSIDFSSDYKHGYNMYYHYNRSGGYVTVWKNTEKGAGYAIKIATLGQE